MSAWASLPGDDMRRPLFRHTSGYSLHYWRGARPRWVLSFPNGMAMTDTAEHGADEFAAAIVWADDILSARLGESPQPA